MKQFFQIPVLLFIFLLCGCTSQEKSSSSQKDLLQTIDKNFEDASSQYKLMMSKLPPDRFPKTYYAQTDSLETSSSKWWCSGFYPGTLFLLFEQTKDQSLLNEAERVLKSLEKEKDNKNTHDLGFMMYCSFGNAERLAPKQEYKEILLTSARSLCTRFNPKVGCIKSWDAKPSDFLVIIDNLMNLELLFWATRVTGDSSFYKIAVTHANTTMQNHFRGDHSAYHVINYDPQTGAVKEKKTAQGAAAESAWARGQAWALYGYTMCYRETKDKNYLEQADRLAQFILHHPNLPADKIPYWDFNAPGIPGALRDASAAAVISSALIELSGYVNEKRKEEYLPVAETILKNLSAAPYKADIGKNGGFVLQHCVGNMPEKTEIDVPLTYADYYFIEAMKRYKALK
jgi:unsaturated chondroitin disaccharide hydrolase